MSLPYNITAHETGVLPDYLDDPGRFVVDDGDLPRVALTLTHDINKQTTRIDRSTTKDESALKEETWMRAVGLS